MLYYEDRLDNSSVHFGGRCYGCIGIFFEYGIGVGKDTKENDSDHEKDEKVQVEEEEK